VGDTDSNKRMFDRLRNAGAALSDQRGSLGRSEDGGSLNDEDIPGAQFVGGFKSVPGVNFYSLIGNRIRSCKVKFDFY
jgi:hypothetical protein